MKRNCSIEGCDRVDHLVRSMCGMHYMRAKSKGEFGDPKCSSSGCEKFAVTRGMCPKHYAEFRRSGALSGFKECEFFDCQKPATTKGLCPSHYSQILRGRELTSIYIPGEWGDWKVTAKGYVIRRRWSGANEREHEFQHRRVMEEHIGRPLFREEEVHHLNGNRSDNRLENLEIWSTKQPKGQRPEDKVEYAVEILRLYAPEKLI